MNDRPNDLLLLAGKVLTVMMQIFMVIAAAGILIAAPILTIFQGEINTEIAEEFGNAVGSFPLSQVLGMLALALISVTLTFFFFGKLRAIISTVGVGDPFAPENAERLNLMAWLLLGVQLLMMPLMGLAMALVEWAKPMESSDTQVDIALEAGFDLTSVLVVVVLFILARVFKHGAAMREDLEGTV